MNITADCTHSKIYQIFKYDYFEEIVYGTEPEIGNGIHKTQVKIVSSYFTGNYNIKQNITMNVNRNQKHGPLLHFIMCRITETKASSRLIILHS